MTGPAKLWQGPETVVPGALRGYRSFRVGTHEDTPCLRSTGVENAWVAPTLHASCLIPTPVGDVVQGCGCDFCTTPRHPAPQTDCTCGIYGWYRPDDTRLVRANLLAVVEVSGRVVLGTHGFRAEAARIVALSFEYSGGLHSLRLSFGNYDVDRPDLHSIARWCKENDVHTFATNAEMIEAYPPEDVSALVQHDCAEDCDAHIPSPATGALMHHMTGGTITYSVGANSGAYASALKGLEAAMGSPFFGAASRPKVPRWKRLAAIVGCVLATLLTAAGAGAGIASMATHGLTFVRAVVFGINLIGLAVWARAGRKAWRWGR